MQLFLDKNDLAIVIYALVTSKVIYYMGHICRAVLEITMAITSDGTIFPSHVVLATDTTTSSRPISRSGKVP